MKPAVLQLIDSFNQGGSEWQALQLTRHLSHNNNFAIHLASLSPEGPLRSSIADLSVGPIPSFPLNSFYDANAVRQLKHCVQWLKSYDIKIIHTHDFYTNVFGMAAAALARLPVRIASMRETAEMRTSAQKQVQRGAYALAHQIIANSKAVEEKLVRDGVPKTKVSVIYNGLDVRRVSNQTSRSAVLSLLGLPEDPARARRFVTIVANMRHEVKDYPMFLRAAQAVKKAVPDAAFLLAGEGELTDGLQRLASELGVSAATFFLGRCEKIAELLSISEVCVLSSKAEGFSNSILEYMAAGRPVVATNVGGAPEVIVEGETGYLVSPGDDATMAARIISLLQDAERAKQFGAAGKLLVERNFSCESQLTRTEELYNRLLQR
ncbi:MAG TPA: glycosyltransferase [Pyrinomonadaceae bacterium]